VLPLLPLFRRFLATFDSAIRRSGIIFLLFGIISVIRFVDDFLPLLLTALLLLRQLLHPLLAFQPPLFTSLLFLL